MTVLEDNVQRRTQRRERDANVEMMAENVPTIACVVTTIRQRNHAKIGYVSRPGISHSQRPCLTPSNVVFYVTCEFDSKSSIPQLVLSHLVSKLSPCIMCVQCIQGRFSTSGGYHEYIGGFQYIGRHHDLCGGTSS